MRTFSLGRYGVLATLLLALLAGTGALAAFNFFLAQYAAEGLGAVNELARQHARPQAILATTAALRNDLAAYRYLGRNLRELDTSVGNVEAALATAEQASTRSRPAALKFLDVSPFGDEPGRKALQELRATWNEYRKHLDPILAFTADPYIETAQGTRLSAEGQQLNELLDDAARSGIGHAERMTLLIGELTGGIEQKARARANLLRQWLLIGLGAAVVFLAVALIFIHGIARKERSLARAKQETDAILRTVNQGLFLLDADMKVGSERSEALEKIFRRRDFANLDFAQLLRGLVPEKTLETALEYVKLLWGERVNEKLIKSINPLSEVEVSFDTGGGRIDTQYLEFDFNRVFTDGTLSRILVTVNDVTRRVELARELQESQEKAQAQLDLLLHILHVDPRQLSAFLEESEVSLKMVNSILKEPAREEAAFRGKIDRLFREIHGVKGEAAALGLQTVEKRAHGFEEALAELRGRENLTGNDFLPLVVKLDDLFSHLAQIREMIGRLSDLRVAISPAEPEPAPAPAPEEPAAQSAAAEMPDPEAHVATSVESAELEEAADTLIQRPSAEALEALRQAAAGGDIESAITQLAERIARKHSKKVEITCTGLDRIPGKYRKALKDIAIQMVRNSLAHGIETPQERTRQNKNPAGSIVVRFEPHVDNGCEFIFQDDGRGLSAHELKAVAVERGLISAEQAQLLDERRAFGLIFMPGFSTREQADDDAGRGVGMDLVRAKVQELGGKLGIATSSGKFLRFRIWLPGAAEARAA